MILLDTSGLLAAIDSGQRLHTGCVCALRASKPPYLLSPFVLAELDYLLCTKVSVAAQMALLEEVAVGAYQLEPFEKTDVSRALSIVKRFADLAIGLADASLVVLAERHKTCDVLTLDDRRFRALRAYGQKRFRILPADAWAFAARKHALARFLRRRVGGWSLGTGWVGAPGPARFIGYIAGECQLTSRRSS